MTLQQEIDERRQSIRTDSYAMSIGEFATLYRDGELFLHPEYQRLFRWTPYQKSRLIESLLLGIPVPSLFVAQRADGVWDVIDGLQRLSTVFEFMGELKDANDKLLPALELLPTHYLPSLKGKTWTGDNEDHCFTREQQLLLKRAKLDVRIMFIGEGNATKSPFDLFDRLNTGGSFLSDQELRNSIVASKSPTFQNWLLQLQGLAEFQECLPLTDNQRKEQYDLELVTRFVVLRRAPDAKLTSIYELGTFLTEEIGAMAVSDDFDFATEEAAFRTTFTYLANALGNDAFRRFDGNKNRFMGAFAVSAFEYLALGIGFNYQEYSDGDLDKAKAQAREFWQSQELRDKIGSGVRASSRIPVTVKAGREAFGK